MTKRTMCLRRSSGFTLIELLVVIVILGILAGVVVFAVQGAGDKGKKAAKDTDLRTLRTAQEAFCAQFGHYAASEAELVNPSLAKPEYPTKGFLSEESETHDIRPAKDDEPKPCNGTGYVIEGGDDGDEGPLVPPGPGSFEDTMSPPFGGQPAAKLVALGNGKVFAYTRRGLTGAEAAVYDSALEVWTPAPPPPVGQEPNGEAAVLLVDDPGTPANDCGSHCGKVLVHTPFRWYLFNPVGPGLWEEVPESDEAYSVKAYTARIAMVLLDDPSTASVVECGVNCGKVFITSFPDTQPNPWADLYDPISNSFEAVTVPPKLKDAFAGLSAAHLKDGRVLLVSYENVKQQDGSFKSVPFGYIFDPRNEQFSAIEAPPSPVAGLTAPTLPDGDVLFLPDDLFRPPPHGSDGTGKWTKSGDCGVATGQSCAFLVSFPNGTVLAHVATGSGSTGKTRRFHPAGRAWTASAPLLNPDSAGASVYLDPAAGGCGANCGKALVVGKTAELYTP